MNFEAILSERLAILGGTGSGKSYTARGLAERVLAKGDRLGVIDPTGVWWGLRSGFPVVLFGGDHADLPITESAGRIVAQAVASSQQSWILDTSALKTKAAERRFMLDFLDGLYENNRAKITLIVDEADRFSPQRMSPEAARLHERMEEIVRRGRVRGFTPWLITQRPASLNKDVLSQATAFICMRMTGAHDRSAIADVIEGQADKQTAKAIVDSMPRHKTGSGLVWAPMQNILLPAQFPKIKTLDTMQVDVAHKRADKPLPAIDLGALKEKLATVETEAKANDPAALRKRIAELEKELRAAPQPKGTDGPRREDVATIKSLRSALEAAMKIIVEISAANFVQGTEVDKAAVETALSGAASQITKMVEQKLGQRNAEFDKVRREAAKLIGKLKPLLDSDVTVQVELQKQDAFKVAERPMRPAPSPRREVNGHSDRSTGQQRILDSLAYLEGIGIQVPTRAQLALWCEVSPTSGGYFNNLGALRSAGLIDYPAGGTVTLTSEGRAMARDIAPQTQADMQAALFAKVGASKAAILKAVIEEYPNAIAKDELAERIGVSPTSGGYFNNLGSLRTLGVIDYPEKGKVAAQSILFLP